MNRKLVVVDENFERTYEPDHLKERENMVIKGFVVAELWNENGELRDLRSFTNLLTLVGNQYYGERAANIGTPPAQVSGMRLGTGTTAVAATGAGAAIVTYVSGSQVAITGGFPTSANPSAGVRRITWKSTWAAGVATNAALAEAVITNEAPLTNVAGTAANTISRVLLSPLINKGAADTLDLEWQHDLGA